METTETNAEYNDEITLKELILKIQEFWLELWKNKLWIIVTSILMAGIFVLRSYLNPQTFRAELTFMVNEDEGNSLGGMGGLLGQFGFPSSGAGGEFNLDKILELSKSRRIIYPAILDSLPVNQSRSIMANHIIDVYDYHKKWKKSKNEEIHNFRFESNQILGFGKIENIVLKSLYSKVVGNAKMSNDPLLNSKYDEATGILELAIVSESAPLSEYLVDAIFNKLSQYYVTKTIEPQTVTVNALNEKTDSIKRALANAEVRLAQYDDANLSLFQQKRQGKKGEACPGSRDLNFNVWRSG